MFIALNRYTRAQRRRLSVGLALAALCASVGIAHGAIAAGHMSMDEMGGHAASVAVAMCLAITETAVVLSAAFALLAAGRRRHRHRHRAGWLSHFARSITPPCLRPLDLRARSSPVRLQVIRR